MQPDEPTQEESQLQLPQDNQTPIQPAVDVPSDNPVPQDGSTTTGQPELPIIDDTYPATDTGIDTQQQYDEGEASVAESSQSNADNSVIDYEAPEESKEDSR